MAGKWRRVAPPYPLSIGVEVTLHIPLERGVGTLKSSRSANALRLRLHHTSTTTLEHKNKNGGNPVFIGALLLLGRGVWVKCPHRGMGNLNVASVV